MALYAMGDLHLNFGAADKSMTKFGKIWKNHEKKVKKNIRKLVGPEDTIVLTGDHSWGRKLDSAEPNLDFIASFPMIPRPLWSPRSRGPSLWAWRKCVLPIM
ncbi:MAG: hypothetical protein U0K57_00265 [Lachnospiraceae bacterium]|nr:hypothetical protein [Lachnospiraceae bacterium]